jgi:N4-gp56 family major capsid protein
MATTTVTTLSSLIDPEVMADSISAELPAKIAAKGFMKVDTTLSGKAGDTITIPRFNYIGSAAILAEGETGNVEDLTANETSYTVEKAVKNVTLTDEAILSGYGNPVAEVQNQLRMAIQDKVDNDAISLLESDAGILRIDDTSNNLSYNNVSNAMTYFADEQEGTLVYLLVSQEGYKQLKADTKWLDNANLAPELLKQGVIGQFAGAYVVISNKLNGVNAVRTAYLLKPQALTAFLKRDVSVETQRDVLKKETIFSTDEHYMVAIEDDNKVVALKHKNSDLGKLKITFVRRKQDDGTYDIVLKSVYPAKFSVNTLVYKLGTAPQAVSYGSDLSSGWTTLASLPATLENVEATPIISVAQMLTSGSTATYFGSVDLMK